QPLRRDRRSAFVRVEPPERMVQLLQDLADKFADFAQGMVRGNPLLRMNVRKHPALILRSSAHLQPSRRIRGALNHPSFALARFFSKLLEYSEQSLGVAVTHFDRSTAVIGKGCALVLLRRTEVGAQLLEGDRRRCIADGDIYRLAGSDGMIGVC